MTTDGCDGVPTASLRAHWERESDICRYNYFVWNVHCPIFPLVRATGLAVIHWHDLMLVNQLGQRFYDESKDDSPHAALPMVHSKTARCSGLSNMRPVSCPAIIGPTASITRWSCRGKSTWRWTIP
jgi:hypothetical protein